MGTSHRLCVVLQRLVYCIFLHVCNSPPPPTHYNHWLPPVTVSIKIKRLDANENIELENKIVIYSKTKKCRKIVRKNVCATFIAWNCHIFHILFTHFDDMVKFLESGVYKFCQMQ